MTNEEKELLLKDLCGRLPYGTICEDVYGNSGILLDLTPELNAGTLKISDFGSIWTTDIDNVKPYLRPMKSMTEEECEEIKYRWIHTDKCWDENDIADIINRGMVDVCDISSFIDWLNKKMFDYRGLIKKGLALEAPENMYI